MRSSPSTRRASFPRWERELSEGDHIGLAWRKVRDRFREAKLATAELDARLIAQHAFGIDSMSLVRREREPISAPWAIDLERAALRRLAGEPVSRIIGEREFWGLKLGLNGATLDPRPETEMLVADAISAAGDTVQPTIIDLGTGSGAIAIALADGLPQSRVTATDLSAEALGQAKANAKRHGLETRIEFRQGNWWQAVPHTELFDLIVSNPPYVSSDEMASLQPEVRLSTRRRPSMAGSTGSRHIGRLRRRRLDASNPAGASSLKLGRLRATRCPGFSPARVLGGSRCKKT